MAIARRRRHRRSHGTLFANAPIPRGTQAWGGWSPAATNARFQTAEQAGLTAENVPRLTLKWAFGFPDATSAWSQPTVSGGRLFVGSQNGTIYALEAKTGCVLWTFTAKAGVRTAVTVGSQPRGTVFFGDTGSNVYALDVETGRQLWSRRVSDHPYARVTGTPTLYKGRLYVPVSSLEETASSQQGYECCTFRAAACRARRTVARRLQYFTVPQAQPLGKTQPDRR